MRRASVPLAAVVVVVAWALGAGAAPAAAAGSYCSPTGDSAFGSPLSFERG